MRPLFAAPQPGIADARPRLFILANDLDQISAAVAFARERSLRAAIVGDGAAFVGLGEAASSSHQDEIAALVKSVGGIFHTDAVQAVGKVPLDVSRTPVDLLSLSGHKLHAPKGIGALYVRRGTRLKTYMIGGHQENGRRGGTENVPYIVGLGKAAELAAASLAGSRITTVDRMTYTITNIRSTHLAGGYSLRLRAAGTGIFDAANGVLGTPPSPLTWRMTRTVLPPRPFVPVRR
jgi:hypothetical protein